MSGTRTDRDGQLPARSRARTKRKITPMKKKRKKVTVRKQLSRAEVAIIADVDDTQLLCDVYTTVSRDLVGELFPERAQLWENLVTCSDKLGVFVNYAADRYIQLYLSCTGCDKHAKLYLKWLDVTREFTCESKQTDETATIIEEAFGNSDATPETMRTVLATLLNGVYLGFCKQMAVAVEKMSTSTQQMENIETAKPSDEVAVQRLCGWALKSATDLLKSQSPQSKELQLLTSLSLDKHDKPQLPPALQYLTFMRPTFLPWMIAVEGKMVQHLNQKSYNQYGENFFQVKLYMHIHMYMYMHIINCNVLHVGNSNLNKHGHNPVE